MLLADAVLVGLAVSAWAGADPGLEAAAAQHLSTGRKTGGGGTTQSERVEGASTECDEGGRRRLTLWSPE